MPNNTPPVNSELWRPVPWAHAYEVSEHGAVRKAVNRSSGHKHRNRPWRYLKPEVDKDGYLRIQLTTSGVRTRWVVSRLVYAVWVGELIDGLVVAHKDGNNQRNHYSNLVQTSQHQNIQHKRLHGTWQDKENHPMSVYTQRQVDDVRRALLDAKFSRTGRLARGEGIRIAEEVEVSRYLVTDVKSGKAWA